MMKKIELTLVLSVFFVSNLFAKSSDDGAAGMVAAALGAIFFYGILSIARGIKAKKSNKVDEE